MSFPIVLSPSPVREAFHGIQWDPIAKLDLTAQEKALLRAGEDNVIEYTLANPDDAAAYVQLLLKVLDQLCSRKNSSTKVAKLPLDVVLPDDQAIQLLYDDSIGVVTHYAITKLCEVVVSLRSASKTSKVNLATTFYPDGILIENWRPLLRSLHGGVSDAYAQRGAAFALACILLQGRHLENDRKLLTPLASILESFVTWMTSRLQSSAARALAVVTPALTVMVIDRQSRVLLDNAGGIGYLCRHLKIRQASTDTKQTSVQQVYELCYCLWLLSFDCNIDEKIRNHLHRDGAVAALVDLVVAAPREKVVRLALAALRNLAVCRDDEAQVTDPMAKRTTNGKVFLHEMVGCGLTKSIDLLRDRDISDPDMKDDLDLLYGLLHEATREMTRWDVYEAEVDSGHLQWSIIHSEKFFRENAKHMEGKDCNFAIVKALLKLASGDDEEVAAIACYDIGEFVRHYPSGKAIVKRMGVRNVVMGLIEHDNEELRRQALQCVSKMLVQNWEAALSSR